MNENNENGKNEYLQSSRWKNPLTGTNKIAKESINRNRRNAWKPDPEAALSV